MRLAIGLYGILLLFLNTNAQDSLKSYYIEDSSICYELRIDQSQKLNEHDSFIAIFYFDPQYRLGKEIRACVLSDSSDSARKFLLVGIGNKDPSRASRRRDFIPIYGVDESNSVDGLLRLIKDSIKPFVHLNYKIKRSILIGHSLSGLFTTYVALRMNKLFDRYIALSPSYWANNEEIFGDLYRYRPLQLNLYLACGSLEHLNKIRKGVEKFKRIADDEELCLYGEPKYFKAATHNSYIKKAISFYLGFV